MLAEELGKPGPRSTEMDFYPIIVKSGFRNSADDHTAAEKLIRWLKEFGSPALVNFAFNNRQKLAAVIDDVWSWETVDDFLQVNTQTRLQLMLQARASPCCCQGMWKQVAWQMLLRNQVDVRSLCSHVMRSLELGSREDVPVVVLMGRFGGEGKSFFLAPLRNVIGMDNVQATPQAGSFPLLGLERRKLVLLDEWTFDTSVIHLQPSSFGTKGRASPSPGLKTRTTVAISFTKAAPPSLPRARKRSWLRSYRRLRRPGSWASPVSGACSCDASRSLAFQFPSRSVPVRFRSAQPALQIW